MKANHTPGPWTVEDPLGDEQLCIVQSNKQAYEWDFIATVGRGDENGGITPTAQNANARLIAAAPELLERLKVMCREWREVVGTPEENRTPGDVLEKAEAVIAKAEGVEEGDQMNAKDKITGYLEVGTNDRREVVINHADLKPDADGVGHIIFSPAQARNLARLLNKKAKEAESV